MPLRTTLRGIFTFRKIFVKKQSLHQIMNEMVQRLDTIQPAEQKKAPKALSELEAFIQMDNLLASLNKEYLEAKSQRKELVRLNGVDDAMTEISVDMEDSAWCAMQTRYIELRQQGKLMACAQQMMRQSEVQEKEYIENEIKHEKERALKEFIYFTQVWERMKEMNKVPHFFQWALLMLVLNMQPFTQKKDFTFAAAV